MQSGSRGISSKGLGGGGNGRTSLRKEATNSLIRDSKGLALELRSLIKRGKDPWDREVEFQREALRKLYLQIIFAPHVSSSSSNTVAGNNSEASTSTTKVSSSHASRRMEVLNLLWLDTSHAIIQVYRTKLTEMDKAISELPTVQRGLPSVGGIRGGGGGGGGGGKSNPTPGPTARRRLLQSFRNFLTSEEEFFRALLSRLSSSLYSSDLAGLITLGITVTREDEQDEDGDDILAEVISEEEKTNRRNAAVPLAHKALLFFGDLARYRELYNDPGAGLSNPSLASTSNNASNKNGKKGSKVKGDGERKVKNWSRAAECYNQARLLVPDNGNPSNQLAVLSQYSADTLSSTYHYYRAISVRSPFPTARTNLDITYAKNVARWFLPDGGEPSGDEGVKFRAAFVVLQGLFFVKTRFSDITPLSKRVEELFKICVEERLLPSDLIVKTVVTSVCALWNARMYRSAATKPNEKSTESSPEKAKESKEPNLEPHLVIHVLSLYRVLLQVGSTETNELVSSNKDANLDTSTSLALNISAVVRRALPSIRILSKWIMGQLEYLGRVEARLEAKEKRSPTTSTPNPEKEDLTSGSISLSELQIAFRQFWKAYVAFSNSILLAFPTDSLPNALDEGIWLEEDVDMLGFAPLRRGMKEGIASALGVPVEIARVGRDVHPNEEQLMRLADIQKDARLVAGSEGAPIEIIDGKFVLDRLLFEESPEEREQSEVELASARLARAFGVSVLTSGPQYDRDLPEDNMIEEDAEEDTEEYGDEITEDDPVDLAMRIATASRMEMDSDDDDDDDDEEIVYRSMSNSMTKQSSPRSLSLSKSNSLLPNSARTAGDLLHQALGVNTSTSSSSSAFAPAGGLNIWAPTNTGVLPPPIDAASFESLPNVTHQAFSPSRNGSFSNGHPLPPPNQGGPTSVSLSPNGSTSNLFGNFYPFTSNTSSSSSSPSRALPLPNSLLGQQNQSNSNSSSDLSALANPFARSPQKNDGWPLMNDNGYEQQQQQQQYQQYPYQPQPQPQPQAPINQQQPPLQYQNSPYPPQNPPPFSYGPPPGLG